MLGEDRPQRIEALGVVLDRRLGFADPLVHRSQLTLHAVDRRVQLALVHQWAVRRLHDHEVRCALCLRCHAGGRGAAALGPWRRRCRCCRRAIAHGPRRAPWLHHRKVSIRKKSVNK